MCVCVCAHVHVHIVMLIINKLGCAWCNALCSYSYSTFNAPPCFFQRWCKVVHVDSLDTLDTLLSSLWRMLHVCVCVCICACVYVVMLINRI